MPRAPPAQAVTTKYVSRRCQMSPGGAKLSPLKNHCTRSLHLLFLALAMAADPQPEPQNWADKGQTLGMSPDSNLPAFPHAHSQPGSCSDVALATPRGRLETLATPAKEGLGVEGGERQGLAQTQQGRKEEEAPR